MHRIVSKILLAALVLSYVLGGWSVLIQGGEFAEAVQTLSGKSIEDIDDIVQSVNGSLSLAKKGLITIRGGNNGDHTYVDVFAQTFSRDTTPSKARKIFTYPNSGYAMNAEPTAPFHPAVSRKLYNGKRAFMFHNIAPNNGKLKYYFKTLSNTITSHDNGLKPDERVDTVQIADLGEYTLTRFSTQYNVRNSEVYGTGFMSLKGYDNEILAVVSDAYMEFSENNALLLDFFVINADSEGLSMEPLWTETRESTGRVRWTRVTHRIPYRNKSYLISTAVGDFDGDKYDNELAVMINTMTEIRLFVYRLILSNGNVELRSLGDAGGIKVYESSLWRDPLEEQPVTDMAAGDFDGDGRKEIAILYKRPRRAENLKHHKGWPDGPIVGDVNCRIYQWNAKKGAFDTAETAKDYHGEQIDANPGRAWPDDWTVVSGVVGLRAVAADLNGDGKDEIATVILGYCNRRKWNRGMRDRNFSVFPHLAVWRFDKGLTPIHDDAHVKGGVVNYYLYKYDFGPLYELVKNQATLLKDEHLWGYKAHRPHDNFVERSFRVSGRDPDKTTYCVAQNMLSITAGPFTGTLGTFKTVDDIAIAWPERTRSNLTAHWYNVDDCVTIFRPKLKSDNNGNKVFDGFEDGKLVLKERTPSNVANNRGNVTIRGLVAVDMASEGVELGKPVHLRKNSSRSYIAALSAIPYHVDTISTDGTALTAQPVNFTYSDKYNGGDMTVSYGQITTDTQTNLVQQDLSQSIETMFAADPKAQGGSAFEKVKGLIGFASGIGGFVQGIKNEGMTTEQKRELVWRPDNSTPLDLFDGLMGFFSDRVEKINQLANDKASTIIIDKTITATTHDAILYTDTKRHVWRYPIITRPLPMWLAAGPRIDSTQIRYPETVSGDKQLFLTFTMSENSSLNTGTSISDALYQPLHEEGNFFSYPSHITDVEGYNTAGLLASVENTWDFSNNSDTSGITFEKASGDMQHTETRVIPGGFTLFVSFFERLFKGDNTKSVINMPNPDNPKTFTKRYNKTEKISYSLQGSQMLTAQMAADHKVKMQPFVAKEGAMTFGTAVELKTTNNARLWSSRSLYQKKPDPSLYLPLKFVKAGSIFKVNDEDTSAMKIRGIRFYAPDFAFFTDNRLVRGQNYEIRVPLYNASFKDTGNFIVRLSWIDNIDNLSAVANGTVTKELIGEITMSLGGWKNGKNNNKGWAVFNWTPTIASSSATLLKTTNDKAYYLYVEIDPGDKLLEVHEARYSGSTINDFGGNNTGFYPFYVYNTNDHEVSIISENVTASDANGTSLTPLYFTDGDGNRINDMASFILAHKDESFVPVTANFNYSGHESPYAFFGGYVLTQSGKQKVPGAGINTIVNLDDLSTEDIEEVFMLQDIALFSGNNQVTFVISPTELLNDVSNEIMAKASLITFGIKSVTEDEILSSDEEFYEGEDPNFELEEIPGHIVSTPATQTYNITANEDVFWMISSVKFNDTVSTSASDDVGADDRDYLDITLETISEDESVENINEDEFAEVVSEDEFAEIVSGDEIQPSDYGKEVVITVSSIAGLTPKGKFEITIQRSTDGDEWENAKVLTFDASEEGSSYEGIIAGVGSSGGGCNTGLVCGAFALLLGGITALRKKR